MDYTGKESTSISLNGLHLYADVPLVEPSTPPSNALEDLL